MSRLDGNLFVLSALIVLLLAVGGLASGGNYLSVYNLQSMANQVPEIGLLAIGVMLADSMRYLTAGKWWLGLFPGLCLLALVLCFDAVGNGLRLILDPRTAEI